MFWNRMKKPRPVPQRVMPEEQCSMIYAYSNAMKAAQYALEWDLEHGTNSFEMLMQSVRIDLWGSSMTGVLFCEQNSAYTALQNHQWLPDFPFPRNYTAEQINDMPFGENIVISVPYDPKKWRAALSDLSVSDFDQHKNPMHDYCGDYYPELRVIQIHAGRHHSSAAALRAQGSATVHVWDLTVCYPYFWTDGAFWYNDRAEGGKERGMKPVKDVRVAILYGMAQMRWSTRYKTG